MSDNDKCPVCQNAEGGSCRRFPMPNADASTFRCDVCGQYEASGLVELTRFPSLNSMQRALLSHRFRTSPVGRMSGASSDTLRGNHPLPLRPLSQFCTLSPGTRENSRTLSVTTTYPSASAWAAMSMSFGPMSCPRFSRCARSSP